MRLRELGRAIDTRRFKLHAAPVSLPSTRS
jgi:hypothetical protein